MKPHSSPISLSHPTGNIKVTIQLPTSKSISNRLLIINKLSGNPNPIENLSTSTDTQNLKRILEEDGETADVKDAGTSMRFLTAYYCGANQTKIITGTERMCERPLGELLNALRSIGFQIECLKKEGYPPIKINHQPKLQLKEEVELDASISSQYVSALLMIAPTLEKGLTIKLKTQPVSEPYIQMTLLLMKQFGVNYTISDKRIIILPQKYSHGKSIVEPDWSAASYWYIIAALSKKAEITLTGLKENSLQGDVKMAEWGTYFGVKTTFNKNGAVLTTNSKPQTSNRKFSFTHNPDLAQSILVMAAVNNISIELNGLESLRIKETDRITAMATELKKLNAQLLDKGNGNFQLVPDFKITYDTFETYKDHRMAMAFAPVALKHKIKINNPNVVSKSYPSFWDDLTKAGFMRVEDASPLNGSVVSL